MGMTPDEVLNEMDSAARDIDKFLSYVGDDAVYWFSNETSHVGKEQIGGTLKRNASDGNSGAKSTHVTSPE